MSVQYTLTISEYEREWLLKLLEYADEDSELWGGLIKKIEDLNSTTKGEVK